MSLVILFGSETGNAQDAAERVAREARRRRIDTRLLSVADYDASKLPSERTILLLVSTAGQGEMPTSMKRVWRHLLRRSLPATWLTGLRYAIFGLGDSSYPVFNTAAKKVDRRFLDLGATPLLPRTLADEQHPSGYDASLDVWLSSLWLTLAALPEFQGVIPSNEALPPVEQSDEPRLSVSVVADGPNGRSKAAAAADEAAAVRAGQRQQEEEEDAGPGEPGVIAAADADRRVLKEAAAAAVDSSTVLADTAGARPLQKSVLVTSNGDLANENGSAQTMEQQQQADDLVAWTDEMSTAVAMMDRALGTYVESSVAPQLPRDASAATGTEEMVWDASRVEAQSDGKGDGAAAGARVSDGANGNHEGVQLQWQQQGQQQGQQQWQQQWQQQGQQQQQNGPYSRYHPFLAQLSANQRLTAQDHWQDVRHLELRVNQPNAPGLSYSPGDILQVFPGQRRSDVLSFLHCCRCEAGARLEVTSASCSTGGAAAAGGQTSGSWRVREEPIREDGEGEGQGVRKGRGGVSAFSLVAATLDIASASPRRYFYEVLSRFSSDERERERLQFFASGEGRDELFEYNERERRTVLEVLEEFPSARPPLHWMLQICPRLLPRSFSISSSPLAHPSSLHLTVAVVQITTPLKRKRAGLCSTWLAGLQPPSSSSSLSPPRASGPALPIWVLPGSFHIPPPSVPLVLVGPGTGCAPFRSIMHQRAALAGGSLATSETASSLPASVAGSPPIGPVVFFFGCRNRAKDFLYEAEWELLFGTSFALRDSSSSSSSSSITSTMFTAFSRDQAQKEYVQHVMRQQGTILWRLLQSGAAVLVAGAAGQMPKEVTSALEGVVREQTGASQEAASAWVKGLTKAGRLQVEAWA